MIPSTDAAARALTESGGRSLRVSAYRGSELLEYDLPWHPSGQLTRSGTAVVQTTGTVRIRNAGDGRSLVPKSLTDPLAPAGQELLLEYLVQVGSEWTPFTLGRFPITDVPDMRERVRRFAAQDRVLGYEVECRVSDRFGPIREAEFLQPDSPKAGNGSWAEVQRLSPYPVVASLPDKAVPASLAYGDSRVDAIGDLIRNVGGVPHVTPEGYITARLPDKWLTESAGDEVFTLAGVIEMGDSMSNKLRNAVVVRSTVGENTILAIRTIDDPKHPLYVGGPFGVRVYRFSSPLITDQAAADAAAATILARVSSQNAKTVTVTTLPDPRIELGDYGLAIDEANGRQVYGEVSAIRFPLDPLDSMELDLITADVTA